MKVGEICFLSYTGYYMLSGLECAMSGWLGLRSGANISTAKMRFLAQTTVAVKIADMGKPGDT